MADGSFRKAKAGVLNVGHVDLGSAGRLLLGGRARSDYGVDAQGARAQLRPRTTPRSRLRALWHSRDAGLHLFRRTQRRAQAQAQTRSGRPSLLRHPRGRSPARLDRLGAGRPRDLPLPLDDRRNRVRVLQDGTAPRRVRRRRDGAGSPGEENFGRELFRGRSLRRIQTDLLRAGEQLRADARRAARQHLDTTRTGGNVRVALRKLVLTDGPADFVRRRQHVGTRLTVRGQLDCANAFALSRRRARPARESALAVARGRRGRGDSDSLLGRPQGSRLSERRRADHDSLALGRDADARGRQSTTRQQASARNSEGRGRAHRRHGQRAGELDVHALILSTLSSRARFKSSRTPTARAARVRHQVQTALAVAATTDFVKATNHFVAPSDGLVPLPSGARVRFTVNARQTVALISSHARGTRVVLSEGVIAAIAEVKKLRPGCEGESAAGPQIFLSAF